MTPASPDATPRVIGNLSETPACCCCQRPGQWRKVGNGRRPFCDTCWQGWLEWTGGLQDDKPPG